MTTDSMLASEIVVLNNNHCILCSIYYNKPFVPFRRLFSYEEIETEVLFQTRNFFVILDIAPIIQGHILIVSKRHIPSMKYIKRSELEELSGIKKVVRKVLLETYGGVVFFEHGSASILKNAGSCIDHAHLHAVPLCIDLLPELQKDFQFSPFPDISKILTIDTPPCGYLFYENNEEERFLVSVDRTPCQYFRRILARLVGERIPWNWNVYIQSLLLNYTKSSILKARTKLRFRLVREYPQET